MTASPALLTKEQLAAITRRVQSSHERGDDAGPIAVDRRLLLQHIAALTDELKRNQDGWAEAIRLAVQHQKRADKAEEHIAALEQRVEELEPAAECWAALSACARIKLMGCAGLHPNSPEFAAPRAHIGLEFWTHHEAKGDAQDIEGRDWFCRFMMKALAVYRALPKEPPRE